MRWLGVAGALVVLMILGQVYVMAQGLSWWPYSFLPRTPESTVAPLQRGERLSDDAQSALKDEDLLEEGIALFCREYDGQVMCEIKSGGEDASPRPDPSGTPITLQP